MDVTGGQRSVMIATPFQSPHQCGPATWDLQPSAEECFNWDRGLEIVYGYKMLMFSH